MKDLHDLLPTLDPPPDGLTRLRARIDGERSLGRRRSFAIPTLGVATAAAVAIVALLWTSSPDRQTGLPGAETSLLRMQLGFVELPAEPVTLPSRVRSEIAVRRVDLGTERVALYLVGGIGAGDSGPAGTAERERM